MTRRQIEQLQPGDEVYWNDPDPDPETNCSKYITILDINLIGTVVKITGKDGSFLECLPRELT